MRHILAEKRKHPAPMILGDYLAIIPSKSGESNYGYSAVYDWSMLAAPHGLPFHGVVWGNRPAVPNAVVWMVMSRDAHPGSSNSMSLRSPFIIHAVTTPAMDETARADSIPSRSLQERRENANPKAEVHAMRISLCHPR